MKLTADRKHLIEKLGRAAIVCPKRSPKEILTRILLVASSDSAEAYATDMEVAIGLSIECSVAREGKSLLPTKALAVLRECTTDEVLIEADEKSVSISCGTANLTFQVENPDEYPRPKFADPEQATEVSSEALSTAIERTTYACDVTSSRFALGGVLFEDSDGLLLVATDGRRLSKTVVPSTGKGIMEHSSCVVPQHALNSIAKLESDGMVKVWSTHNDFHVKGDGIQMSSRLVEGRYPNWRQVVPNIESHNKAEVASASIERALKQAAIVTDAETRAVNMLVSQGTITLAASAAEIGRSNVSIPVEYDGPEIEMRIDYRFALDFLSRCGDTVEIYISEPTAPVVMKNADYLNLIMPMAKE
jgi:DNA polymerase-3 subunit beta